MDKDKHKDLPSMLKMGVLLSAVIRSRYSVCVIPGVKGKGKLRIRVMVHVVH